MNQSMTKAKTMLIAITTILFVFALLIFGIVEIRQYNVYNKQISAQEQQIEELQNAKNYYNSKNYEENASRDNGYANNGDIIFGEE